MKKLKIIISIFTIVTLLACETNDGQWGSDLRVGAVANIVNLGDPSISYGALLTGGDFDLGFTLDIALGAVSSADVIGYYTKADGTKYGPATLSAGISTFPSEIRLNKTSVVSAFSELTSPDDFALGDILTISAKLYLADGTTIDMLDSEGERDFGSDIHTSSFFEPIIAYGVVCDFDPELTVGTYDVVSDDWGVYGDVTVEADPSDPYKLFIIGMADLEGLVSNGNSIELSIDPGNFAITGPESIIAADLAPWGLPYVEYSYTPADGLYNSCTGAMDISFAVNVSIGGWGPQAFFLTRK